MVGDIIICAAVTVVAVGLVSTVAAVITIHALVKFYDGAD